jgi:hypothetical protein
MEPGRSQPAESSLRISFFAFAAVFQQYAVRPGAMAVVFRCRSISAAGAGN